jgi:NAD-dependent SIR2 family protein deacetylase
MERVNRNCAVCGKTASVPVNVHVMMATNLAQARSHGAAAYCQRCDASYCFDHIVWTPTRISETNETMTNVPVCPKCGELMGGLPG